MAITLKHHLGYIVLCSLSPLPFLGWFLLAEETDLGEHIAVAAALLFVCVLPLLYHTWWFVTLRRKSRDCTRQRGLVVDWTLKHTPKSAHALVVRQGARLLETPRLFSYFKARRAVGREIEFANLDGYMFVFRILDKPSPTE